MDFAVFAGGVAAGVAAVLCGAFYAVARAAAWLWDDRAEGGA